MLLAFTHNWAFDIHKNEWLQLTECCNIPKNDNPNSSRSKTTVCLLKRDQYSDANWKISDGTWYEGHTFQKQESVIEQNGCLLMVTALYYVFKTCIYLLFQQQSVWTLQPLLASLDWSGLSTLLKSIWMVVFVVAPLPAGQGYTERNSTRAALTFPLPLLSSPCLFSPVSLSCKFNKVHIV